MSAKKIDALYLQGKGQEDSFTFYYDKLRPLLIRFARTIGRQSVNQVESHLIEEMVDDLLLELDKFQEKSRFSTYAYVRFRRQWINEYRFQEKRLGDSLESLQDDWKAKAKGGMSEEADYLVDNTNPYIKSEEPTIETDLIIADMQAHLNERQRFVLKCYREGFNAREISEKLGISQPRVYQIWQRVLEIAKDYGNAVIKT